MSDDSMGDDSMSEEAEEQLEDEEQQYGYGMKLGSPILKISHRHRRTSASALLKKADKAKGGAKMKAPDRSVFRHMSLVNVLKDLAKKKSVKTESPDKWKWSKDAVNMISTALETRLRKLLKDAWMVASYGKQKTVTENALQRAFLLNNESVVVMKSKEDITADRDAAKKLSKHELVSAKEMSVDHRPSKAGDRLISNLISIAVVRRLKVLVGADHIKPGVVVGLRNVTRNFLQNIVRQLGVQLSIAGQRKTVSGDMVKAVLSSQGEIVLGFHGKRKGTKKEGPVGKLPESDGKPTKSGGKPPKPSAPPLEEGAIGKL